MSTKLWHNEFKDDWMWALPLGNGRIGAMQYGNPHCEQIEINEESLWCGRRIEEEYHASPEALAQIRKLIFEEKLKEAGVAPYAVEGYRSNGWVLLDYTSVLVHIFTTDARDYYDLDRLWGDGEEIKIDFTTN